MKLDAGNTACSLVAMGSAWGVWKFFWEWLESWLGDPLAAQISQAQLGVVERRARFTQW